MLCLEHILVISQLYFRSDQFSHRLFVSIVIQVITSKRVEHDKHLQ
jgi:hypothetical protein